jgi:anti-sigma factor RsiW
MTSNYDDFSEYDAPSFELEENASDCFELLSAYIDGEATVEERKQVQQLLDNDPQSKELYLQLLKLQGGIQNLTVPTSETTSAKILSERVFDRVDRSHHRQKAIIWSGAIAATIITTIANIVPNSPSPSLRIAENSSQDSSSPSIMVAVSLSKPTVIIPKAAVANSNPNTQERI